jgi:hypothetical protein
VAISILDQGGTGETGSSTVNDTVTVASGAGNRRLIVCASCESDRALGVTLNGTALTLDADIQSADGFGSCRIFSLLEADMPANGSQTLAITYENVNDQAAYWWLVDGCDQGTPSTDTATANSGSASQSVTVTSTDDDSFLAAAGYQNTDNTSLDFSAPSGMTDDQVLTAPSSGLIQSHKNGSIGTGSITVTNVGVSSRRVTAAALYAPAAGASNDITAAACVAGAATFAAQGRADPVITAAGAVADDATFAAEGTYRESLFMFIDQKGQTASGELISADSLVSQASCVADDATFSTEAAIEIVLSAAACVADDATFAASASSADNTVTQAACVAGAATFVAEGRADPVITTAACVADGATFAAEGFARSEVSQAACVADDATFAAEANLIPPRTLSQAACVAGDAAFAAQATNTPPTFGTVVLGLGGDRASLGFGSDEARLSLGNHHVALEFSDGG